LTSRVLGKLVTNYRKALCEYKFLKNRSYPDFVFNTQGKELQGEVPVFCFHSVTASDLEEKLLYLVTNGYQTFSADELHEYMLEKKNNAPKAVVLTFDDGWRNLWTTVYPLLKKYGLKGVSFIVPAWLRDDNDYYPNLEDYWHGKNSLKEIMEKGIAVNPYVSWSEVKKMHESGVIDFQSHSMTHGTIFTSDRILDFVNPHSVCHRIPFAYQYGQESFGLHDMLGMPLYTYASRLAGARRYLDDPRLRETCMNFVRENGGEDFFTKHTWRKRLATYVEHYKTDNKLQHGYETDTEREEAIAYELGESRVAIENRLGKSVFHICYPFFTGSELVMERSKKYGYISNFWGWQAPNDGPSNQDKQDLSYSGVDMNDFRIGGILDGRRSNKPGDDPYKIVRLPGDYVFSLPGKDKCSVLQIILKKCLRNLTRMNG
jgi:hypothetical protein